jgi:putative glycosyltransferase
MKISVVTTLYGSEKFIPEFCRRVQNAVNEIGTDYELILVNDGSPDNSLAIALDVCRTNPKVRVIDLARNFGHHPAIMVGLQEARGDYIFLIDVDLEEAPENLVAFYQDLVASSGTDVVYGIWRRHGEGLPRRIAAEAYYALFNFLGDTALPRNLVLSRLMTRRYVDALLESWTWDVAAAPVMAMVGFGQQEREIQRTFKGSSAYSVMRRLKMVAETVTSFSARPLHYIFLAGVLVCALSLVMTIYAIGAYLSYGQAVAGWYSVFVSLWFIGGLSMMSMGVLGLYIARIFEQVKGKPRAIVRQRYTRDDLLDRPEAAQQLSAHE